MLTFYYAATAFGIVLLTTGVLHWSIVRTMDLNDDRKLSDRVTLIRAMIQRHSMDVSSMVRMVGDSSQNGQRPQLFVRVLDSQRRVVAESPGMGELSPVDAFPQVAAGQLTATGTSGGPDRTLRLISSQAGTPAGYHGLWHIQVALDRSQEEQLLFHYRRNACYLLGGVFLICVGMGYAIARKGTRPILAITEAASHVQVTSLDHRIETSGLPSELQQLAGTFNDMLARLERSFGQLSRFSADIAHELRTPIQNLRGVLDVALETQRTPGEYEEALGSGLEECDRLSRLVDSLLFLARAENPETQVERSAFEVRDELERIVDFFESQADEAGVTLTLHSPAGLRAELNRPLFQQAVGNLLTNAFAYTPRGGQVSLSACASDETLHVSVTDTGSGIPEEHLPHVFTRFFRADSSRTQRSGGVGLGLAIVKSIVELHRGTAAVESKGAVGTRVRLSFPLFPSSAHRAKMTES